VAVLHVADAFDDDVGV